MKVRQRRRSRGNKHKFTGGTSDKAEKRPVGDNVSDITARTESAKSFKRVKNSENVCQRYLDSELRKISLVGNPNTGKSCLFNYITGMCTTVSNYSGTSVEISEGLLEWKNEKVRIVDLPGSYSLAGTTEDEKVASRYLKEHDPEVIINLIDVTFLERNLYLTMQLKELGFPVVVGLNFYDEFMKKDVSLDIDKLSKKLGLPVVPVDALRGKGIPELVKTAMCEMDKHSSKPTYASTSNKGSSGSKYEQSKHNHLDKGKESHDPSNKKNSRGFSKIKDGDKESKDRHIKSALVLKDVLHQDHPKKSWLERFDRFTTDPFTGLIFLVMVMALVFTALFRIGDLFAGIIDFIFMGYIEPVFSFLISQVPSEAVRTILEWTFIDGINAGLQIAFPYVFVFYVCMSVLEDTGYLPRMGYILDKFMHKLGLHGKSIVPMLLGFGCTVPAILGIRTLSGKKEKLLTATLVNLVPCSARTAVIMGATGRFIGWQWALLIYGIILLIILIVGFILARILPGESSGLIMELPPYRMPSFKNLIKKSWFRLKDFFYVAFPIIIAGSSVLGVMKAFGLLEKIMLFFEPFIVNIMQLPAEAGITLIYGILRKEMALEMLAVLGGTTDLTVFMAPLQIFVFSLITALYFPCIGTFAVMKREFGWKNSLLIALFTVVIAFGLGLLLSRLFAFFGILV